jgi:hypothetical protein
MVWSMSYRPKPDSYPMAEVTEGNSGELELEDMTDDGGVGLRISRWSSGRRVKPESIPKAIRWMSKRELLDFETVCQGTVSQRFRALIEEIEPGIHQFEPIRFIAKDRSLLADRWFWQVCNRLDSVNREKSDWVLLGNAIQSWSPPSKRLRIDGKHHLVFDVARIGDTRFWHDKHISTTLLVSDAAKSRIELAGITGVHFRYYDQA